LPEPEPMPQKRVIPEIIKTIYLGLNILTGYINNIEVFLVY